LVITAYAIANVIVIPMTIGFHSNLRRNFAVSIIIFTVALLCGNATNIWELVAFRFIQGLGVGAIGYCTNDWLRKVILLNEEWLKYGVIVGPPWDPC
jgi:MFS family permease